MLSGRFQNIGYAVDEPRRLVLVNDDTGEPIKDEDGKEGYIDLISYDSRAAAKLKADFGNRRLQSRGRQIIMEAIEVEQIDLLAVLTKGWHLVDITGVVITDDIADAREVYSMPELAWIRRQAEAFAAKLGNFTRKAPSA